MWSQENRDLLTVVANRFNEFRMFLIKAVQPISDKGRVNQRRLNLNDWLTFVGLQIRCKVQNRARLHPEVAGAGGNRPGNAGFH
jgi:hypothetical protein